MKRIIDVNLNRTSEALRVLEEIARFSLDNKAVSAMFKNMRHDIINTYSSYYSELLSSRNTEEDIGREIPNPSSKPGLIDVYKANFKRLQQALRTLSEYSGILSVDTGLLEKIRYESYTLEKVMFQELTQKFNKKRFNDKKLYLVTDRSNFSCHNDFLNAVAAALEGGVSVIQLREKTASTREFIGLGKKVRELCALYDAIFIVNDRVDIAQAINADGVHLGQEDMDIQNARKILGEASIIGISTHSPEQASIAVESGADYIGVGPVYSTPTKPGRPSVGLEYVKWASGNVDIPWFAIGGINRENLQDVISAGAEKVAVVRAIINAEKPDKTASEFLELLNSR